MLSDNRWVHQPVQLSGVHADGTQRSLAAAPQIESLNPLVALTALPTLSPFVRYPAPAAPVVEIKTEMIEFLRREKVDVVVGCDLKRDQIVSMAASRLLTC